MASRRLARDLVLTGLAFVVAVAVPFFPYVITIVAYEFISFRSHLLATVLRTCCMGAVLVIAIAAWRKSDVRLAVLFIAMLITAAAFVVLWNWF